MRFLCVFVVAALSLSVPCVSRADEAATEYEEQLACESAPACACDDAVCGCDQCCSCDGCGHCNCGRCCTIDAKGPCEVPCCLPGTWIVTHCIEKRCDHRGHSWIRYENVHTCEVHTVGLYLKGWGGVRDECGNWIVEPAEVSGIQWDMDLKHEEGLRCGEFYTMSVSVCNPRIYRGRNCGYGHGVTHNNCVTYSNNAWYYYSGEKYELPHLVQTTNHLLDEIEERHPEMR